MDSQHTIYVDVREPREYAAGHVKDALNLPLSQLSDDKIQTLPKDARIILYCRTGNRSGKVAKLLRARGYDAVNGISQATIENPAP